MICLMKFNEFYEYLYNNNNNNNNDDLINIKLSFYIIKFINILK